MPSLITSDPPPSLDDVRANLDRDLRQWQRRSPATMLPVAHPVATCAACPCGQGIGICGLDDTVLLAVNAIPSDCPLRRGPVVVRLATGALIAEPMQAPQTI